MLRRCAALVCSCLTLAGSAGAVAAEPADASVYADNIVRLSKIRVDPAQIEAYKEKVAKVGRESMRLEKGVRVLYSLQQKNDPAQFYILEVYADEASYRHHVGTAHFKEYKEGTKEMVTDLELIDCNALVPEALIKAAVGK